MSAEFVKRLKRITKIVWLFFLDLIFPIECLGCGAESFWLCEECFKQIKLKPRQYCLECKKENDFGEFCPPPARLNGVSPPGRAIRTGRSGGCGVNYSLDGVWIAALYDELLVSRSIKDLKYYLVTGLADDLSRLIILFVDELLKPSRVLKSGWPPAVLNFSDNLIVPVPLAKRRLRWRGFNQAELLARQVAEKYKLELDRGSLVRIKHKKPQAKLSEIRRLENVKECFSWQGGDLNKRNVILLDDVVTTGATLNECAKVLKAAGAGQVWGLVVAKG